MCYPSKFQTELESRMNYTEGMATQSQSFLLTITMSTWIIIPNTFPYNTTVYEAYSFRGNCICQLSETYTPGIVKRLRGPNLTGHVNFQVSGDNTEHPSPSCSFMYPIYLFIVILIFLVYCAVHLY